MSLTDRDPVIIRINKFCSECGCVTSHVAVVFESVVIEICYVCQEHIRLDTDKNIGPKN